MYPEILKKYQEINKIYPNKAIRFIRPYYTYYIAPGPPALIFC